MTEGLLWAKKTWGQLLRLPGKPFESLTQAEQELSEQVAKRDVRSEPKQAAQLELEPPICGVHQIPMVRVNGREGPFWSCHEKNEDGSWCSYKPNGREE